MKAKVLKRYKCAVTGDTLEIDSITEIHSRERLDDLISKGFLEEIKPKRKPKAKKKQDE